jgi:two-component system, cell cycle sensor histidine kinase and response regulator CckA
VFVNLLINAAHAIPAGRPGEHEIRVAVRNGPHGTVIIEVSDTGVGIPARNLERIFDPFFTTKPSGVGTGLGLSICASIVSASGGELTVESVEGRGSTFRVSLPVAGSGDAVPVPIPGTGRDSGPIAARLLVVDEEPAIGKALRRMLRPRYLETTGSGIEGLARCRGDDGGELGAAAEADCPFDIVVYDIATSDLSGPEMYRRLQEIAPELARRLVLTSAGGGAADAEALAWAAANDVLVLEKPFDAEALATLLAARAARGAVGRGG